MIEELEAYRSSLEGSDNDEQEAFLLEEGLDLLGQFRAIKSPEARKAVILLIASIVEAEKQAAEAAMAQPARR